MNILNTSTQFLNDIKTVVSVQQCFEKLKLALCTAPILAYPKPDGIFILDTDASNIGIGGILQQVQDGKEQVIAYASKKLDKSQQRYSVTGGNCWPW
jgi:hypothetical protein